MPSFGATVTAREPSNRFGFTVTYMQGKANGVYTYDDGGFSGDYKYRAKRKEFAGQIEFTPRETGVTLITGYHHFSASNNEVLLNPGTGNSEVGRYRESVDAAEVGLRIASRLGANSRHSVSAQFMAGRAKAATRSTLSRHLAVFRRPLSRTSTEPDILATLRLATTTSSRTTYPWARAVVVMCSASQVATRSSL